MADKVATASILMISMGTQVPTQTGAVTIRKITNEPRLRRDAKEQRSMNECNEKMRKKPAKR